MKVVKTSVFPASRDEVFDKLQKLLCSIESLFKEKETDLSDLSDVNCRHIIALAIRKIR